MKASQARVETGMAGRYLAQLCKHFAHKVKVQQDGEEGRIEFPFGICTLQTEPGALILNAQSGSDDTLLQLEDVVARHLERFAFRDKPSVAWQKLA